MRASRARARLGRTSAARAHPLSSNPVRVRGRTWPLFLAFIGVIAALASIELYPLWREALPGARSTSPASSAATTAPGPRTAPTAPAGSSAAQPIAGAVDRPPEDALRGPSVAIAGWTSDPAGIAAVEIRFDGRRFPARLGLPRPDVAKARGDEPGAAESGFEWAGDLSAVPASPGVDRRPLQVVAITRDDRERILGTRDVVEASAVTRFAELRAPRAPEAFRILPALSAIGLGGALELDRWYAPYLSSTIGSGMRVPILYLRTTLGKSADYVFDPEWNIERRCGERRIAEDSLGGTIAHAIAHGIPVLFTLNGGVWADASCDVPDWDVNDHLEQEVANCQWNEKNEVMPDDYLKHLPGSQDAPELARTLTFNVYARDVRRYKRRNLQQAGAIIARFAREHPDLFIGVNLDPDTYMNPFFDQQQWYDYNPGTLRQFREWLSGTGPYAGRPSPGVPDLSRYRRARPLTLAEAGRLARRTFARWDQVDPPRAFPKQAEGDRAAFWDDPWTREWETFRRHLVDLHYDELSEWLTAVGIPARRIWSSQGFMAPHASARPFAVHIDSPMKNYDTGGMSVEGSIPAKGHLGAILYGPSAVNDIRMETPASLFATFRALDPGWAVVEINTADLRSPASEPTYAAAYRSLRDIFNYGGRFVSPMAWNGSNGVNAGKPGYVTFTAWRNTPFEEAARDFMLSHANVPLGARLWTFGTPRHVDGDAWTAESGQAIPERGALRLAPDGGGVTLISPREVAFDPSRFDALVLGLDDDEAIAGVALFARTADGPWREIGLSRVAGERTSGGRRFALAAPADASRVAFDQVRIDLRLDRAARLLRVVLWPKPEGASRAVSARRP